MPLTDRYYIRGEHPPACTCNECSRARMERTIWRARKAANTTRWLKMAVPVIAVVFIGLIIYLIIK